MTEIQQYRKDSAEWMEIGALESKYAEGLWYMEDGIPIDWHPDKDYNQMAMMEDKLIEEGLGIQITYYHQMKKWGIQIYKTGMSVGVGKSYSGTDKDKRIAFMKAFMEYYKQTKGI